ncbi:uncharacterized protein K444DRAFT_187426 [Hyaloscypha bicolor E]|uniref:Zn(2)-C6 fungal-type domain-containing protein n=1 Tax=Hyaloscypha bicolor E TaxID=1095630 RepID=A0A2J6SPF7_9HELO|nr:uncharacterized protein K444DRAFT_187426 [Hyaloscypha bicolor E]PMD52658.1 hypothetical protein K444DRAFT_187426 [Hyaloscypha bicolor E]
MLANPLLRFSGHIELRPLPSNSTLSSKTLPSDHINVGADALQGAPQQPQQHVDVHQNHKISKPFRRKISRACDQCNQLRMKCNGQSPCAHCVEFGLGCEYRRERRKCEQASRKDLPYRDIFSRRLSCAINTRQPCELLSTRQLIFS